MYHDVNNTISPSSAVLAPDIFLTAFFCDAIEFLIDVNAIILLSINVSDTIVIFVCMEDGNSKGGLVCLRLESRIVLD